MKIATWNCCGGLDTKFQKLLALNADVMVVQECLRSFVEPPNLSFSGFSIFGPDGEWPLPFWHGHKNKKGLAVFARTPWTIGARQSLSPKWSAKILLGGPCVIDVYAVWTHENKKKDDLPKIKYADHIHRLLDLIEREPLSPLTIVVGDFNSYGDRNHFRAVDRFLKLGMESAYHKFTGESHGSETRQTHRNNKSKDGCHIDYAFLSQPLLKKLTSASIEPIGKWPSDHAPLLIDLDI